MPTIAELEDIAPKVVEMAALARAAERVMEVMDQHPMGTDKYYEEQDKALSQEYHDKYRQEFSWIIPRLEQFRGIDTGGVDGLAGRFYALHELYFKAELTHNGTGPNPFEEQDDLDRIITLSSSGRAFTAFGDNFLDDLPTIWGNQSVLALTLADTAVTAGRFYEKAREDAMAIAQEAIFAYSAIYSEIFGDGQQSAYLVRSLIAFLANPFGGLSTAVLGYVNSLQRLMGVLGLVSAVAGAADKILPPVDPPKKAVDANKRVRGGTTREVSDSLAAELADVVEQLGQVERDLAGELAKVNTKMEESNVFTAMVPPDMSAPR